MSKKPEKIILEKKELAAQSGLSVRHINRLIARGLPCEPGGDFILEKVQLWRRENLRQRSKTANNPELAYWKNELVKEQSKLLALKRRQTTGELIDLDEVCRSDVRKIATVKVLLEQIPDRVLGHLPKSLSAEKKKEFLKNLQELIEDTLFTLAKQELGALDAN
jgi:phage terminase Nu1 subunit (DNA packaging protein)